MHMQMMTATPYRSVRAAGLVQVTCTKTVGLLSEEVVDAGTFFHPR